MAAVRFSHGVTIVQNQYSAKWRRLWWITDIGRNDARVRRALIEAAGHKPEDFTEWTPRVSFPSLRAAISAITRAAA